MIKHFAKTIESELNDYARGINASREFKIFTDAGEYEDVSHDPYDPRSAKDRMQLIYGILDADPSKLAPIPGLSVVTYAGTLEVMVEAKLGSVKGSDEFVEVGKIESILNGYSRLTNGKVYRYEETGGKVFTVTISFSPAVVGDWQVHSTVFGEVIPVSMAIYLTAVENGVSANDLKLWIDGYPVCYENLVLTRQKTTDQYTFEETGSVKSTVLQHAFGVDFTCPLLHSDLYRAILKETLDGSFNIPHVVTVGVDGESGYTKDYLCVFGTSTLVSQPGKNVGATVSLVEAEENVAMQAAMVAMSTLDFGDHWSEAVLITTGEGSKITASYLDKKIPLDEGKRYAFIAYDADDAVLKDIKYGSFVYNSDTAEEEGVFPRMGSETRVVISYVK